MKRFIRTAASVVIGLAVVLSVALPAAADGVARVTKIDGSHQVYQNVLIRLTKRIRLTITSADGRGSLIVDEAACSYEGTLEHCLLIGVSLNQDGVTNPLTLQSGTALVNLTAKAQPMPQTTQTFPPYGIVLSLTTKIGTHILVSGTIDGGSM
jgi:hypothetical protein